MYFLPIINWLTDLYNIYIYLWERINEVFYQAQRFPAVQSQQIDNIDTQDDPKLRAVQLSVEDETEWLPNDEAGQMSKNKTRTAS